MSQEHRDHGTSGQGSPESWASWASPVGLGLFFVLGALAFDLVRLATR